MKFYKTYQDCKIANPSSEVVQRNGDAMFLPVGDSELIPMLSGCIDCKPSEYLISIKDFFDRGHVFLVGDCFLNQHGEVIEVGKRYEDGIVIMPDEANRRIPGTDENCYILRAAAMEIPNQTQEEREALDMIDTTSKQVEKPNSGQDVYIAQINTLAGVESQRYFIHQYWCDSGHQNQLLKLGILFTDMDKAILKTKSLLGIPHETPEQKAERERREEAEEMIQCLLDNYTECEESAVDYVLEYLHECDYRKAK